MLTHCPECQKELSTAANQCPHCGAPVNRGQITPGQAPMAQPVGAPPAPQSHCLRNCVILGCLLIVLGGAVLVGGSYYVGKKMMSAFTKDPAAITAISQNVAGSATVPAGYTQVAGVDFGFFSFKAKGVILQKGGDPKAGGTVIAYGALTAKPQEKAALRDSLEKAMQGATGGGQAQQQRQVVSQEEVDMQVGTETQKVLHITSTDQQGGNKMSQYFVFLDGWNNEFGWLGVGAMGPDDKFDLDGFKAFLASLKK